MKKVLFLLLCVAAVAVVPACKFLPSCKKEVTTPTVPPVTPELPAAPAAPAV